MDSLSLIKIAVSLGDAETLIQHPATMTHSVVSRRGAPSHGHHGFIARLSVGLEHADDLIEDMEYGISLQWKKQR